MLHELAQFAMAHWVLVLAFMIALILLFIEEAKSQGGGAGLLSATGLTQLINRDDPVIVDIRDADAFQTGHIIHAKNFPASTLTDLKALASFRDQPIVLVDASGQKAGAIAQRLKKEKFENIHVLKGGIAAWKSADMPTVKANKSTKTKKKGK